MKVLIILKTGLKISPLSRNHVLRPRALQVARFNRLSLASWLRAVVVRTTTVEIIIFVSHLNCQLKTQNAWPVEYACRKKACYSKLHSKVLHPHCKYNPSMIRARSSSVLRLDVSLYYIQSNL